MIAGLDSASEPSAAQALAAQAAGVRLWSGYLATQPNVGLFHPWSQQGFENARLCGSTPIAYCSGWDDPTALRARAAAWNLRLCLDIESGIRGNGSWAQNWLDESGAGVYGNAPVHRLRAAFHVLAAYPGGDPQATWPPSMAQPATPCGWQFQGTHPEFGVGVDRGWFDDWFAGLFSGGADELTGPAKTRRTFSVATANSLHQFCRGTDKSLFHRKRSGGAWSAWKSLGGTLSTDVIGGGLDETGALVVTVVATDGSFVDITSADDGATWSAFSPSGGGGDGLLTISAGAPAVSGQALDLKAVLDAIAAIKVPTTITGKLA